MIFAFILDTIIAVLLAVTIYYCYRLNGFLKVLRDGREDLAQAVQEFNEAVVKAEQSVDQLRQGSQGAVDKLSIKIEKAEFMADDLAYLIEKANKMADQLSGKVSGPAARSKTEQTKPEPRGTEQPAKVNPKASGIESIAKKASASTVTAEKPSDGRPKSKAEMELLQALKSIR
jgi:cell division septum initiation protein DivIVA